MASRRRRSFDETKKLGAGGAPSITPSEFYHGTRSPTAKTNSAAAASSYAKSRSPRVDRSHSNRQARSTRTAPTIYTAPSWARQQTQQSKRSPQENQGNSKLLSSGLALPVSALSFPVQTKKPFGSNGLPPFPFDTRTPSFTASAGGNAVKPSVSAPAANGSTPAAASTSPSQTQAETEHESHAASDNNLQAVNGTGTRKGPFPVRSRTSVTSNTSSGPKSELSNSVKGIQRKDSHDEFIHNLMSLDRNSRHSTKKEPNNGSGPIQFDMMNSSVSSFSAFDKSIKSLSLNVSDHNENTFAENFKAISTTPQVRSPNTGPKPSLVVLSSSRHRRLQQQRRKNRSRQQQARDDVASDEAAPKPIRTKSKSSHGQLRNRTANNSNWDRWSSESTSVHAQRNFHASHTINSSSNSNRISVSRAASWEVGELHSQPSSAPVFGVGLEHPLSPSSDLESDVDLEFDTEEDGDDDINDMDAEHPETDETHYSQMQRQEEEEEQQQQQRIHQAGLCGVAGAEAYRHDDDDVDSFAGEIDHGYSVQPQHYRQDTLTPPLDTVTKWSTPGSTAWDDTPARSTLSPHLVDRRKNRSTSATTPTAAHMSSTTPTSTASVTTSSADVYPHYGGRVPDDYYLDDLENGGATASALSSPVTRTFMSSRARRRRRRHQKQYQQQTNLGVASSYWSWQSMKCFKGCFKRFPCLQRILFPSSAFLWQSLVLLTFGCGVYLHASHRIAVAHEELHATHVEKSQILQQMEWMNRKSKEQLAAQGELDQDNLLDPQLWTKSDGLHPVPKHLPPMRHDPSAFDSVYAALFGADDIIQETTPDQEDQKLDVMLSDSELAARRVSSDAAETSKLQYQRDELLSEVRSLRASLTEFAKERLEQTFVSSKQPQLWLQIAKPDDRDDSFTITVDLWTTAYPYTVWMVVNQLQKDMWNEAKVSLSEERQPQLHDNEPVVAYNIEPSASQFQKIEEFKMHWFELSADDTHKSDDSWTIGIRRNLVPRESDFNSNDDASPDVDFPDMAKSLPYLTLHRGDCCNDEDNDALEICFGRVSYEGKLSAMADEVFVVVDAKPVVG